MVVPATVSFDVALAPMGVVGSNSPTGTLTTQAVHCSDALGVTVTVPEAFAPVAFHHHTETRCAVPPKLPEIVFAVSPFGPPGSVPCVTLASDARQQMIRSPSACAGRETAHEAEAVLFPLSVQSPASIVGGGATLGETLALGLSDAEGESDAEPESAFASPTRNAMYPAVEPLSAPVPVTVPVLPAAWAARSASAIDAKPPLHASCLSV